MLNCAIIGFGGLGKVHFKNISLMDDVNITALCDIKDNAFSIKTDTNIGKDNAEIDISKYVTYADYRELLTKETLDFVIIAVPTYLHAEISIAALEAGVHTFCEKPMARSYPDSQRMLAKAKETGKKLMIGHTLRFYPEYVYLREKITSGEFGHVISANFERLSLTPAWSCPNWFLDYEKSGGAAMDLHIHDVDMIYWLFGFPQSVSSSATHFATKFDSIRTSYSYTDYPGMLITAVGDWGLTAGFGFRMSFFVRFEKAVIEMNPQGFFVYTEKEIIKPELPKKDSYYEEIREFILCITENRTSLINPPEDSADTLKLTLLEIESATKGEKINA